MVSAACPLPMLAITLTAVVFCGRLAGFGSSAQNEFERALSNALAGEERVPEAVFEGFNSLCVVSRELASLQVLMESELRNTFSPESQVSHLP